MKKNKIISVYEQNAFVNGNKSCNGGGYSQPLIEFVFNGLDGTLSDESCGEFGTRYWFSWGELGATFSTMNEDEIFSNLRSLNEEHQDLVKFLDEELGYKFPFKEDIM